MARCASLACWLANFTARVLTPLSVCSVGACLFCGIANTITVGGNRAVGRTIAFLAHSQYAAAALLTL